MDQQLELRNHASVIGPATDFAYRWGLNVGLSDLKAQRRRKRSQECVGAKSGAPRHQCQGTPHPECRQ
jgi:hypothetical protein